MKLVCFGDSYTADFKDNLIPPYVELNIELLNYGIGGTCNDIIFETFIKKINELNKNDIVIIGWTFLFRFKWYNINSDNFVSIISNEHKNKNISKETATEILVNRSNIKWSEDIELKKQIVIKLSELIGFKIYFWSVDEYIKNELNEINLCYNQLKDDNNILILIKKLGGKNINEETQGIIDDKHFGESGHIILSELFYDHIVNFKKNRKLI
jgi:hypothetical protein